MKLCYTIEEKTLSLRWCCCLEKISLEPFDRILSDYEQKAELAVSVGACSTLAARCQRFGVEGYRLGDFRGAGYLNRYVYYSVTQAPMLIYRRNYLIPLVFRQNPESYELFAEEFRLEGFFILLDWYLKNEAQKVILRDRKNQEKSHKYQEYTVIDSAFLVFRLSEIIDAAGLPLSQCQNLNDFKTWNKKHHLIDNGLVGRHAKLFDEEDKKQLSELKMILNIIQLKYPQVPLFI